MTYTKEVYAISARRACKLFNLQESSLNYKPVDRKDDELRAALKEHAANQPGWGYRGLMDWLIRDGFTDNHKRVYRVYAEEGLQLGRRPGRTKTKYRGSKLEEPSELNALWVMDFLSDQLADHRVFRVLPIMDVFSRECLAIEVDTSMSGDRVARVLDRLKPDRGVPQVIGTDNGPEFRSRRMDQWAYENNVKLHFIKPGTPTQNAYIESLNSQIRRRLLRVHWFTTLDEVRYYAEEWRMAYNTIQRHGSLGKKTPAEFAAAHARLRSAPPPCGAHGQVKKETLVGLT